MTAKDEAAIKARKAEGTLGTFPVLSIQNNPYRPDAVFVWNEDKILGLAQTYKVDGVQSTFEVTTDKWDKVFLAGGAHHRVEAMRRIIRGEIEGIAPEDVRGLFKNDAGDWCIKVVKKKYTKEQMMRNFMIENADAWNKDAQQNICMMVLQVKDHLDKVLLDADDVDEFVESVNSPYPLKMDERAFTRSKNNGVGATTLVQYLGENTWSRQAIDMAIKVLYADGPEGKALKKLAEKLPSITMAYKFKHLMTQEVDGDKVLSSAEDQEKAEKIIERNNLSRADLEAADKIKKDKDMTPLAALEELLGSKKAEKDAAKGTAPAKPTQAKVKESEAALEALKHARNSIKLLVSGDDKWSKAQFNTAKDLFKDMAADLKKMENGNKKKK